MLTDLAKAAAVTACIILYIAAAAIIVAAVGAVVHPIAAGAIGFFLIMTPCIWAVS